MIRNEYRRAFIMLRAALPGYSGHVRLERRTLTGSMYFIVTAPQGVGELFAALVGQQNGEYYAASIGPLTRDRRGQLTRAWPFDPRSIDGRPLEAYAWVAVVATGGPCALAMTGNVEGARPMDLQALTRAACGLFSPDETPAADLPEPEASPAQPPIETPQATPAGPVPTEPQLESPQEAPDTQPEKPVEAPEAQSGEMQGDVRIYTRSRVRKRSAARSAIEVHALPDASSQGSDANPGAESPPADSAPDAPAADQSPGDASPSAPADDRRTAAQRLGLDITVPWPEAVESLRRLFATQAPVDAPLPDGFTYVRAPVPQASGYGDSLVGLKADGGRITGLRYALPARRAPEPPAGLENYRWLPANGEDGYWVLDVNI